MKAFRSLLLLLLPALLGSCSAGEELCPEAAAAGRIDLRLQLAPALGVESRADGGAAETAPIAALRYLLVDAAGNRIDLLHQQLADDCSHLLLEGLKYGDYTLLLLATTDPEARAEVADVERMSDIWLRNPSGGAPLDESWFYRSVALRISREQPAIERRIVLERCVGRVELDLQLASEYLERYIRNIEVTFDGSDVVSTAWTAAGEATGNGSLGTVDLTAARTFCSLPSHRPLSGSVRITAARSDGSTFDRRYQFAECRIEAGKVARIAVAFDHPEQNDGTVYVGEADFARLGCDTMFLAREPREIFYDATRRSFYADQPLKATIDSLHRLQVQFYSPVPIRNAVIRARFHRVSNEFFDLARFDLIYPFFEGSFELPVTQADRSFTAADGRQVLVPAQPGLTAEDVTLEVVCDDPFMQKIATIDSHWYICYSAFQADEGHAYWRHMDPEFCRHGVALALNMAYIFASPEFVAELQLYKGKLLDNEHNPIDLGQLRQNIRTHSGLTLGRVEGVGGLGGGRTYGLADYCYREVYWDWNPDPAADPHTYVRMAMFHEYGHCLGYSHDSTMTYGEQWTVLCATLYVEMGRAGKLPVCSKSIIADLPM